MDTHGELFQQLTSRWQAGQRVFVEQLLAEQVVALSLDSEQLLELIFHEIALRDERSDEPQLDEYRTRFSQLAEDLETEWAIYRSMNRGGNFATRAAKIETTFADSEAAQTIFESNGRYEIREELGRGAIGVVFQAWDTKLHRLVAIKRLRTGLDAGIDELQRMQAEAHAIAQLHHPNIVQIYDVGSINGIPFLAMEYCAGGTLADRIMGQPIPYRKAADFVRLIALGVAAAHEARIVHRDLKPGNILLTGEDWIPKISDFGLAKLLDNDSGSTATGSILGSPSYMAPEQAFGDSKLVGPESDIYSLGAILYECLTGRPPFRGATVVETLDQVRRQEPISVRKLEPEVPIDLETIVQKCLRKEPAQRYESANAVAEDLQRYLNQRAIFARRERWHELGLRSVKRYPVVTALIAASVLLLLTIVIGSLEFARNMYEAREATKQSEREARLGQADALVGRAHGIRLSGRTGQRFESLKSIRAAADLGRELDQPPEWFEPLRDEAIAAMLLVDTRVDWLEPESAAVFHAVVSPDQSLLALALENGQVLVRSMQDRHVVVELPIHPTSQNIEFVGTDRLLTIALKDCSVELWKLDSIHGSLQWSYHPDKMAAADNREIQSAVSQDLKTALVTDSKELFALKLDDGELISRWSVRPFSQQIRLALNPAQPWVLLHSYFDPCFEIRDWRTGKILHHCLPDRFDDSPGYSGADWSAEGTELLILSGHGRELNRYALLNQGAQLELKQSLRPSELDLWPSGAILRWDSLNDRIFFRDWSGKFYLHDFRNGQTTYCDQGIVPNPMLDHHGVVLVQAPHSARAGVLRLAVGQECRCVSGPKDKSHVSLPLCYNPTFDPAGRFIVATTNDGIVLIDASAGRVIGELNCPGWGAENVSFDTANHFYIATSIGTVRFPYRLAEGSASLEIGLPERIHMTPCLTTIASSDDGETLVAGAWNGFRSVDYSGGWIKPANEPAARWVRTMCTGSQGAVSPNGQRVAIELDQITVYDSRQNCRFVLEESKIESGALKFTSDGRRLIDGNRLLDAETGTVVATWDLAVRSVAQDERAAVGITAAGTNEESIALFDLKNGRTAAKFQPLRNVSSVQISPDKSRMVTMSEYRVWVYDLLAIRAGLDELGLSFGLDELLGNPKGPQAVAEVRLPVELQSSITLSELFQNIDRRTLAGVDAHPDDGNWQFSAGMAAIESRDFSAADKFLTRAVKLLPDAITPRLWRAFVAAEMENYEAAIADANWVLEQGDDPRAWLLRSEWNFRLGRYEEAIRDCTECLDRQFPQARFSLRLRAKNHAALGNAIEAEADETRLAEKASTSLEQRVSSIRSMVGADLSLRRSATALLEWETMKQSPQFLEAKVDAELTSEIAYVEGLVCYRNGRYEEAIAAVNANFESNTGEYEPLSHLICALAHAKLGQTLAANRHLASAEKISTTKLSPVHVREIDLLEAEVRQVNHERETKQTD